MVKIEDFHGNQFQPEDASYTQASEVYATSSYGKTHDMHPGLVVQPLGDADVVAAIRWARKEKLAISIKSGGHQYSGACSTYGNNIMMDLSQTYRRPDDVVKLPQAGEKTFVRVSVSQSLGDLNAFLTSNSLFVPTGQCIDVHVGGHGQTGGYGQLGRSFGLLGDHIYSVTMYDHAAEKVEDIKEITPKSDPELFYGITGGSPGNFGVITHYTIEVHRDADYIFNNGKLTPHAVWALFPYGKATLERLLSQLAAMSDDKGFKRNYDFCVSVVSSAFPMKGLMPKKTPDHQELVGDPFKDPNEQNTNGHTANGHGNGILGALEEGLHNLVDDFEGDVETLLRDLSADINLKIPAIVVYAQWVPFSAADTYDAQWFDRIRLAAPIRLIKTYNQPMSAITGLWLFRRPREYDLPYVKRTYATNSTNLSKSGWVDAVSSQIDKVANRDNNGTEPYTSVYLSCQIQCFGGDNSMFFRNAGNGTSYSWRDSTVLQTIDAFYTNQDPANEWQKENDELFKGPQGTFSPNQDRRVLWGSYGENWNMADESVWQCYYENRQKYERLGRARAAADPNGTFTPNPFAVKRA